MRARSLSHLSNRDLLTRLSELLAREREITAELILHLAEVFRRRLYVAEGYPSMHAYCVGALGMSEDSAGKRIRVVRMARRFPVILEMIADGRLHLSAVCLLAPHLKHENAADLLEAATRRTKRQIEQLLAERFPQDDVPALVQPIGSTPGPAGPEKSVPGRISNSSVDDESPNGGTCTSAAPLDAPATGEDVQCIAPQANAAPGSAETQMSKSVPGRILPPAPAPRPRLTPLAPQRFAIQFTMDQAMHDDLIRAQQLLGHAVAPGEITEVFRRALRELVTKLDKQKCAALKQPKAGPDARNGKKTRPSAGNPRRIPAGIRRAVWLRDQRRCTFVSGTGHRCESREALEIDHVVPVSKGGKPTLENLRLLCPAHNQYEANQVFGEGFMHRIRERARQTQSCTAPG